MRKIIFLLLILCLSIVGCKAPEQEAPEEPAPPSPPGMAQQQILNLFCADAEGNRGKDVTLSCTSNADCTIDKLEAFCSPDSVALPACGPELICDSGICKAQCLL